MFITSRGMAVGNEYDQLRSRLFFTAGDLSRILGIRRQSIWVLCNRRVKAGRFIRLKNNFYILDENWRALTQEGFFKVANFLQAPSYISLLTALAFHNATTQVPQNYYESIAHRRSATFDVKGTIFRYYRIKKILYFGFEKKNDFFIATKERALVDAIYLASFGKYKLDFDALDISKFDLHELRKIMTRFPSRTRAKMEQLIDGRAC